MSNHVLALILALLIAGGLFFFLGGGGNTAEAPTTPTPMMQVNPDGTHTMPDGSMMESTDQTMGGMRTMRDGTVMSN